MLGYWKNSNTSLAFSTKLFLIILIMLKRSLHIKRGIFLLGKVTDLIMTLFSFVFGNSCDINITSLGQI